MGVFTYPLDAVSGAPSYTGEILRQTLSALVGTAPSGRPLGATSGVRAGTPNTTVSVTGAGPYTWNCAAHSGVLDVETSATAGPYLYAVSTTQTGTITAADATNPRIDIVYVQLSDPAEGDGTTTPQTQVLYLAGTAAASPSAPATPARSMVLAQLNVPKSGTGAPTATWTSPTAWPAGVQGVWTDYTPSLARFDTGAAIASTGTPFGRYMILGKTVFCKGNVTANAASSGGGASVLLPFPSRDRDLVIAGEIGIFLGTPPSQIGSGLMSSDKLRVGSMSSYGAGVADIAATQSFRWAFSYEMA